MGTNKQATMVMPVLTVPQYDLIYNMTSLGLASMGASTVFFFLRLPSFKEEYRAALCFTGLVTFIACYHYFRIFDSFNAAYTPCKVTDGTVDYNTCSAETFDRCWKLGLFSGLMIPNGYPGETSGDASTRWFFWVASMCPFMYIVYTLFVGLKDSQEAQPEACRDQVKWACWATVFSWCTYPVAYILPMMSGSETGKAGLSAQAITAVQTGYTISDIISKCGVGYLVYRIGLAKSQAGKGYDAVEA